MLNNRQGARNLAAAMVVAGLLAAFTPVSYGASVNVSVPTFAVTINGTVMDNAYSEYPCIVYKNITYFPMTYYDCRFLGLETDWNQASGLTIEKTGMQWEYKPYKRSAKNGASYTAATASGAITVNGEAIDNSKEEYPLLLFRGVTYFPLTWRFAVDSFGWDYEYTNAGGLVIKSGGIAGAGTDGAAAATSAKEVILPVAKFDWGDGFDWGGFVQNSSYYYYQGDEGKVYQAPVSNPADRKLLHQMPDGDFYVNGYRPAELWVENGKTYLRYRMGGATMGHDEQYLLGEDGTCTQIDPPTSNFDYKDEGDMELVNSFFMGGFYAYYRYKGDAEYTEIKFAGENAAVKHTVAYLGNDTIVVSVEGYTSNEENGLIWSEKPYFYKYNVKTGAREKLCDLFARSWQVVGDTIYFYGQDEGIYKLPLGGGTPEKLGTAVVNATELVVAEGTVFYKDFSGSDVYMVGQEAPLVKGGVSTIVEQNGYLKIDFYESQYKYMIIDKNGKEVAKTIENVVDLYMHNGQAVYVKNQ